MYRGLEAEDTPEGLKVIEFFQLDLKGWMPKVIQNMTMASTLSDEAAKYAKQIRIHQDKVDKL